MAILCIKVCALLIISPLSLFFFAEKRDHLSSEEYFAIASVCSRSICIIYLSADLCSMPWLHLL